MARTAARTVDEYIAALPDDVQGVLRTVRRVIREAVPDAEEVISYQMPAYRFRRTFLFFGGFKKHYSLFCPDAETLVDAFKNDLARYETSKGTIRFPLGERVPVALIRRIAKHRATPYRQEKPQRERSAKQ